MIISHYDKVTKEFTHNSMADPDPLEQGRFLIPAYATSLTAPSFSSIKNRCFFRENEWVLEPLYTTIKAEKPPKYFKYGELNLLKDEDAQTVTECYNLIPYTPDEMSAIRTDIWNQIKQLRDKKQLGGVKVVVDDTDYWFHTDIQSQIQHLGLYETAKNVLNSSVSASMSDKLQLNGHDLIWKCMGNKMLILTVQIVFDLIEADKKLMNDTFLNAEIHKANLYESDDPLGYDFSTNWPTQYEEI